MKAEYTALIAKCRCKNVWCPECVHFHIKKLVAMLLLMNWRAVRHVVLTLDRSKFQSPSEGLIYLKKSSAYFIQYLKRNGFKVKRYVRVLEWHKDGYPHLHLLIESNRIGMIGGDVIRKFYKLGQVNESYFKNKQHFESMINYAGKTGYISKEKNHQSRLPEWALKENVGTIRRYEYSLERNLDKNQEDSESLDNTEKEELTHVLKINYKEKREIERNNYEVVIKNCGKLLHVSIYDVNKSIRFDGIVRNSGGLPGEFNKQINKMVWYTVAGDLFEWLNIVDRERSFMPIERYMFENNRNENETLRDWENGIYQRWQNANNN